jgi:hypothetical protein
MNQKSVTKVDHKCVEAAENDPAHEKQAQNNHILGFLLEHTAASSLYLRVRYVSIASVSTSKQSEGKEKARLKTSLKSTT